MSNSIYIVSGVVLILLYVLYCADKRRKMNGTSVQDGNLQSTKAADGSRTARALQEAQTGGAADHGTECCGKHAVCEKQKLAEARLRAAQYFDDEELDRFSGRQGFEYTDDEVEEFRYVLYTMRQDEVRQWMECLQARNVELPDMLKEEAYAMMNGQ
mgnify:CR=1 FL=1